MTTVSANPPPVTLRQAAPPPAPQAKPRPASAPVAQAKAQPAPLPVAQPKAKPAPPAVDDPVAPPSAGVVFAVEAWLRGAWAGVERLLHPPKPTAPTAAGPRRAGMVHAKGQAFELDGAPFRFVGVNCWNLMELTPAQIDATFARVSKDCGAQVVRFMAFQSYTKGGTDWSKLDFVMQAARAHGVKVLPVLENQWPNNTQAGYKDAAWYQDGYTRPYGNYGLSLPRYADALVSRYKDEPAVFSWMLMNEAECQDPQALYRFTQAMSAKVKQHDPNHMLTLGVLGGPQPGMTFGGFAALAGIGDIDYVEYHDYAAENEAMPATMASRMADAAKLKKPFVVGEAGMTVTPIKGWSNVQTPASRAQKFDAKLDAFFQAGGAGYMVWDWRADSDTECDFTTGDPLEQVLAKRAAALKAK